MNNIPTDLITTKRVYRFGYGLAIGAVLATGVRLPFRRLYAMFKVMTSSKLGSKFKMVLVVRSDINISKGKMAAHCALATISCYSACKKHSPDMVRVWIMSGMPKVVLRLNSSNEEGLYDLSKKANEKSLVSAIIKNSSGGTQYGTVLGIGPAAVDVVDLISGHLKLL